MTILRHFQFDAAHMLSDYKGKCSNLHGHTYTGDIEIVADVSADTGMVLDYNDIKKAVGAFDHTVIFSHKSVRDEAENALLQWCQKYGKRYVVIPEGKCTAESIARLICFHIIDMLPAWEAGCSVTVCLHETPDSTAVSKVSYEGD